MTVRAIVLAAAATLGACAMPWDREPGPVVPTLAGTRWVGVLEGSMDPTALPRLELTTNGRMAGYSGYQC